MVSVNTRRGLLLFLATSLAFTATSSGQTPWIQGVGRLDFQDESTAAAVSADGQVVVGWCANHPFRWTSSEGMSDLGSTYGYATAANHDGSVIVGTSHGTAFRWTADSGLVNLVTLPGGSWSHAEGVSADGSVVVGSSDASGVGSRAFRWTAATGMVSIGGLPGAYASEAWAVSADGSVVIGISWFDQVFGQASLLGWRWSAAAGFEVLARPATDSNTVATSVCDDGSVVVGIGDRSSPPSSNRAVAWALGAGQWYELGPMPEDSNSYARDVNADASVIVGHRDLIDPPYEAAFAWNVEDGMADLESILAVRGVDLMGWSLQRAVSISADGRTIVGEGINPDGELEGWVVTMPCQSDYDLNTFVNGDDFDAFTLAFEAGDPAADINHDTFVTGDDFDFFMDHFVSGC